MVCLIENLFVWTEFIPLGYPDNEVHGTNMGTTSVLSAPDGSHVGPMSLAIRVCKGINAYTLFAVPVRLFLSYVFLFAMPQQKTTFNIEIFLSLSLFNSLHNIYNASIINCIGSFFIISHHPRHVSFWIWYTIGSVITRVNLTQYCFMKNNKRSNRIRKKSLMGELWGCLFWGLFLV